MPHLVYEHSYVATLPMTLPVDKYLWRTLINRSHTDLNYIAFKA